MKNILIGIPLMLLTGCAGVVHTLNDNTPHSTFSGQLGGVAFKWQNPKDTVMSGFNVTVSTNGSATMQIQTLSTVMSPTNIVDTGNSITAIVAAQGTATVNAINAAANAAGSFTAAAAKTATK